MKNLRKYHVNYLCSISDCTHHLGLVSDLLILGVHVHAGEYWGKGIAMGSNLDCKNDHEPMEFWGAPIANP